MPITLDDFKKIELRVGKIISAERVEKSEKLLKLSVDLGEKNEAGEIAPRQILSGIAKKYAPEDLINKQAVFIVNLEPRKLMGMESNGMLLAATNTEGLPLILSPGEEVMPGTIIR